MVCPPSPTLRVSPPYTLTYFSSGRRSSWFPAPTKKKLPNARACDSLSPPPDAGTAGTAGTAGADTPPVEAHLARMAFFLCSLRLGILEPSRAIAERLCLAEPCRAEPRPTLRGRSRHGAAGLRRAWGVWCAGGHRMCHGVVQLGLVIQCVCVSHVVV